MKKFKKYGLFAACCVATAMYTGCGDSSSNAENIDNPRDAKNPNTSALPDTVASFSELQMQYTCNSSLKCQGTYLLDMGYVVCDGENNWTFGSLIRKMDCGIDYIPGYDDPISSSSLSNANGANSSSSVASQGNESSSSVESAEISSSSEVEESSSSDGIKYEQKVVCSVVAAGGACDAMDKNDVSTWHFVGKDAFDRPVEYTYAADGRDLIVTIKDADGTDTKTYSMYNMTSEVGVEMAFSAAKSTCKDVGGNEAGAADAEQTCDTLLVPVVEYGTLTDARDSKEYKTVTIGKQVWMAENLKYEKYSKAEIDGEYFYTWGAAIDGPLVNDTLYCGMDEKCDIDINIQGICPDGWRLPSKADFKTLLENVGDEPENYLSVTAGGKDLFGLSVVLTGYYNNYNGALQSDGENINLWAADNSNWRGGEYATSLEITDSEVSIDEFPKDWGASVRCMKDAQ